MIIVSLIHPSAQMVGSRSLWLPGDHLRSQARNFGELIWCDAADLTLCVLDNLSQIFAVSAHQHGRELILRRWSEDKLTSVWDSPAGLQPFHKEVAINLLNSKSKEQNDEAQAEVNADLAAAQQTEINAGM